MLKRHGISALLVMASLLLPAHTVQSAELDENLIRRVETMERDLKALKRELEDAKRQAAAAKKQAEAAGKKAAAEDDSLSKWHLAGYTSADFTATDAGTVDTTFGALKFNPVVHYQYSDLILFEGELEFELEDDGSTKTSLEYASLDFFAHDYLTVVAGQFLSPLGQFQERLHPSWINKLPDRPAGFAGGGGMLPLSELGIMVRGGIPLNSMTLNYSIYAGNGPQVDLSSGELEKLELEAFGGDDNDDKAVGGRIGILPVPYVEIGASFLASQVRGKKGSVAGAVSEGDFTLWAVDAAYTRGAADLRFEYMSSELDSFLSQTEANTATTLVPKTEWEAWYVQAAYRLSGFTDTAFLKNLELVARYGEFDVKGFANFVTEGDPEEKWTIGINYLFAPSVSLKTALSWRNKTRDAAEDATEFKTQLSYGF